MSSSELKPPLTDPAPLDLPYNFNSYQFNSFNGPGQVVPPPEAPQGNYRSEEIEEKKEECRKNLYDGDYLEPGSGPAGIPEKHFNLDFEHCFTEHKSTKTFSGLYRVIGIIYKYTKLVLYHIFVILIGIPLAILWAIINGITIFCVVWMWGPALKLTILWVYALAPAVTVPLHAVLAPLVDVSARIFRQIRIRVNLEGGFGKKMGQEHIA